MTFNPNYAELLGRELQRDRLGDFWKRIFKSSTTYPVSHLPKNSPSL